VLFRGGAATVVRESGVVTPFVNRLAGIVSATGPQNTMVT